VAQIQAKLAVKAWEEHALSEEFVAEAMVNADEAFEAKGQAEMTLVNSENFKTLHSKS
jgi:hypothetical protein